MGWTWVAIVTSRTRLTREGLYQRWIWDKTMAYDDLAFGKLIRVRGLDWLDRAAPVRAHAVRQIRGVLWRLTAADC